MKSLVGDEKRLLLTPKEYGVLQLLTRRPNVIRTRAELLDFAWSETYIDERSVDTVIKKLRRKIRETFDDKVYIGSSYGFGYYWDENKTAAPD